MDNRLKTDNRAKENCAMKLYQMTHPETGITYRLIYIDIEQKIDGHLFMFGLDRGTGYERFMVDKNLHLAAERYGAVNIDEPDILGEIFQNEGPVMIVGYTATELEWINSLACRFGFSIPECTLYLDAKRGAHRSGPRLNAAVSYVNYLSYRRLITVLISQALDR